MDSPGSISLVGCTVEYGGYMSDLWLKIKAGDLYDNPEGYGVHGAKSTMLVCSLHHKEFEGQKLWNCLQLWWYHGGLRGGHDYPEPYTHFTTRDLLKLKLVGNMYDAINKQFGVQSGTHPIHGDK